MFGMWQKASSTCVYNVYVCVYLVYLCNINVMNINALIILHVLGIKKKIMAAGKNSGCKILIDWAQSVSNHVYWCAASSHGNQELVKAKWLSVLNHVCDIHEGHGDLFPACEHGYLG